MLRPIHRVPCTPALQACQRLMQHLVVWLCKVRSASGITQARCAPPQVPTAIEGVWLWSFLQQREGGRTLLERAHTVADLARAQKRSLSSWAQVVADLAGQFRRVPPAPWPTQRPLGEPAWTDFKALMEAFYTKAFKSGLPYLPDGTPTTTGGVTYTQFLEAFRAAHRLDPDPEAREGCTLCGGPLGQPEVDHWVAKASIPLLAVCADNLLPICGECNATANKGGKPVHTNGSFREWFHPYLRHASGTIRLSYTLPEFSITVDAARPVDAARVRNLDSLLNLRERWTREFKAEYRKQREDLLQRRRRGRGPRSLPELVAHLQEHSLNLLRSEPHHDVHRVLAEAMLDPARVATWQSELGI